MNVCHIKSLADFEDDVVVAHVNKLSNLIGLCPNCHWEFDHKLIKCPQLESNQQSQITNLVLYHLIMRALLYPIHA